MKTIALAMGFLFSLIGVVCISLVAVAAITSGVWGLGHVAPILLVGVPSLALGIGCVLFGSKARNAAQS